MIVIVAVIYYLAYSFALLLFPIYRVPSLYLVASPFASPALILAMILAITGGVILIAKFNTGVRDRDARRVLGITVGWALLNGIPFSYQGPWMLFAAAEVAAIAAFIYLNSRLRCPGRSQIECVRTCRQPTLRPLPSPALERGHRRPGFTAGSEGDRRADHRSAAAAAHWHHGA